MSSLYRIGRGAPAGGVYGMTQNGQQLMRVRTFAARNSPGPTHDRHKIAMRPDGSASMITLDARADGWAETGDDFDDVVPAGVHW